jgi:hypothetical protein
MTYRGILKRILWGRQHTLDTFAPLFGPTSSWTASFAMLLKLKYEEKAIGLAVLTAG